MICRDVKSPSLRQSAEGSVIKEPLSESKRSRRHRRRLEDRRGAWRCGIHRSGPAAEIKIGDESGLAGARRDGSVKRPVRDKARREESWGKLEQASKHEKLRTMLQSVKGGFTVDS